MFLNLYFILFLVWLILSQVYDEFPIVNEEIIKEDANALLDARWS